MTDLFSRTMAAAGPPGGEPGSVDPTGQVVQGQRRTLEQMSEPEMAAWNDTAFDRGTGHRRHVERAGLLGLAFLLDQHYVDFIGHGTQNLRLVQQQAKRGRIRTIEQVIEPAYRGEIARLLRNRPRGVVIPEGFDPEDHEAAEAGDQALTHIQRESGFEPALEQAVSWQVVAGNALLATHWDAEKTDRTGEAGVVQYRSLGPFEFAVPQPRTALLQDQPWVMITKRYEIDEVEDRWGIRVGPDSDSTWGALDERIEATISGGTRGGNASSRVEEVVVRENWIKPSPFAPEGAVLITAGGRVLDLQIWPTWCERRYPFEHITYIPIPGAFWAKGFLQALIPLQRRHNRAASTNLELLNIISQFSVAVPKNTQVRQILGGRGSMFETPAGSTQPVTNVTPPPLGDLAYRELEHTRQAVKDISYQHEVSKGYTPPNVRSGTAISMLKEMDDSASTIPLRSIERAVERAGAVALAAIKDGWDVPRMVRVLSNEGELEAVSFLSGDDVGGQYFVEPGSAWPYTRAEKQGMVLQLLQNGLIMPPEAMKVLDLGSTASVMRREREVDERHARRENQKMEALQLTVVNGQVQFDGEMPIPEDWHNHLVHLEAHQRVRKSPKYERWNPLKKKMMEAHIAAHMAAVYAQMAQQMHAAPAAPAPPPPAPPPDADAGPGPEPDQGEEL